jgi:hypothetical protein
MLDRLRDRRATRVDKEGSPQYRYSAGAIAAGATEYVEVNRRFPDARKYEPLNSIRITNMSTELILLVINGGSFQTPVPAGTIISITEQAVWTFSLTNQDSANATTSGEVYIQLQKAPLDADSLARKVSF